MFGLAKEKLLMIMDQFLKIGNYQILMLVDLICSILLF